MMVRPRSIDLSNGVTIQTPMLIPALSSLAMGPIPFSGNGKSLVPTTCSIVHSDWLIAGWEGALSVSAFDINYQLLTDSTSFYSEFQKSRYASQNLIIIDSGEYETKGNIEGHFGIHPKKLRDWSSAEFTQTVDKLDHDLPALVVNMTLRDQGSYGAQISYHQKFFGDRRQFASTILLRPLGRATFHQFDKLSVDEAADCRGFDVVGVTERELGDSIFDRLVALRTLRSILDSARVNSPIHVFGGLDPIFTPLLFAAGGEIFDGLGWLRYSYKNGLPFHRAVGPVIDGQIRKRWHSALASAQLSNLDEIRLLEDELQVFASNDGDWSKIRTGDQYLKSVIELFEAKIGG